MTCTRCQGFMVEDHFMDFDGTIGHMWVSGHRCMNCGNVHDAVIQQHRLAQAPQPPVLVSHTADVLIDPICESNQSGLLHAA